MLSMVLKKKVLKKEYQSTRLGAEGSTLRKSTALAPFEVRSKMVHNNNDFECAAILSLLIRDDVNGA